MHPPKRNQNLKMCFEIQLPPHQGPLEAFKGVAVSINIKEYVRLKNPSLAKQILLFGFMKFADMFVH